jgi:Tol biopolymer transport system component
VSAPGYSLIFDEGDPSTYTTQIVVQSADGSGRSLVTSYNLGGSGIGSMARFSPDGTKIIYQKATPQDGDLYFVDPNGSGTRQLTLNAGLNAGAMFSPNGDRILFLSTRTGNYELWMMDGDGYNQRQLTHYAGGNSPGGFSPSGSQIAFTRGNGSGGYDIWVSNTVPDNDPSYTSHQVTAVGGQMSNVRWSPDGTKLLVVREGTLYTVDPAAHNAPLSAMAPIPTGGHSPLAPDWSSDGTKIAFVAANEWVVYTMNADGTGLQKVPTPVGMQENFASFKPAGIPQLPPPSHATLSGSAFFDLDLNGKFDPVKEVGLAGWTVQLTGPVTQTTITDGNGAYQFTGLTDGDYQVCIVAPAGWTQSAPKKVTDKTTCATGIGYLLTVPVLMSDATYSDLDFGWVSQ